MNYTLHPFPSQPLTFDETPADPPPDIRETLTSRIAAIHQNAIANRELLDTVVESLRDITLPFYITHCHEVGGDIHLSVAAAQHGYRVTTGDEIRGGLYIRNSESCRFETLICTRLFRVVCANGMLMECDKEQSFSVPIDEAPPANWQKRITQVIQRSFDDVALDLDCRRFEATGCQTLVTPYEFLCNLAAQRLITDDEQSEIQSAFNDNADFTLYGLINAVSPTAHEHRASDRWVRAFEIERLAGDILRGDHNLPAFDAAYSR
jgi:hypothetical protein